MMNRGVGKIEDISDKFTNTFRNRNVNTADTNVRSDVQLSLKSFFYTWTVGNFSKCLMFSNPKFFSPEFVFENTVWRLRFHATENKGEKKISIRLVKKEPDEIDFFIKTKVSLIDDEGKVLAVNETESCFQGDTTSSGQIPLSLNDSKSLELFNDKLIVHCEFLVLGSGVSSGEGEVFKTASDFKLPPKVVPPKKNNATRPTLPAFPQYITSRLNERGMFNNKEGVLLILLIFLSMQYIFFACEITMKYEEVRNKSFDAKYSMKRKEMNDLIIDSTLKLKSIAEALNLTDVKLKANEVLNSYLKLHGNGNSTLQLIKGSKENDSEFFSSSKNEEVKQPMFRELKNGLEAGDIHY